MTKAQRYVVGFLEGSADRNRMKANAHRQTWPDKYKTRISIADAFEDAAKLLKKEWEDTSED